MNSPPESMDTTDYDNLVKAVTLLKESYSNLFTGLRLLAKTSYHLRKILDHKATETE